ncbi:MAG: orotate phosphoribosyltransferase [Chloroflexi bacterium]|nr:orotate phosphoribosyltransferase [Chloroflexota bacterium]MBP8055685.1 orotate phosphoribosyltransferase [Chloroflexota bacterium]
MLHSLAETLFDCGAVRLGQFTLHSGRVSPIYLDLRVLVSYPHALQQVAAAYSTCLTSLTYNLLAAVPYAGLPIGVAISLHTRQPLIYPRKEVKSYGTGKGIEGVWQAGQTAVMIEDLVTSGDSVIQGAGILRQAGLIITEAVVLIDREQGGRENLAQAGLTLHAVTTLRELLNALVARGRVTPAQETEVIEALWGS